MSSIPPPPPPANHPVTHNASLALPNISNSNSNASNNLSPLTPTNPNPNPTSSNAASPALSAPILDDNEPGPLKFDVDLWDKFEEVFNRVTRGRHDLKKIKSYMEERGEAEKAYGRALRKAHEVGDLEEASSLTQCWKDLTTSGPNLSKQHEQFGVMCEEVAACLEKCIVDLKNTKTKLSLQYKKLLSERSARKEAQDKARKSYVDSIKLAEQAIQNRDQQRAINAPPKTMEKVEGNMRRGIKEVESAHILYKKSVSLHVDSQKAYDAGIIEIMLHFEKLERQRLKVLAEQLDRFAQSHEFLKSSLDQIAVFLKRGVSGINVPKDIQDYIAKNRTGAAHPPYAQYEPITSLIIENASKSTGIPGASTQPPSSSAPSAPPLAATSSSSSSPAFAVSSGPSIPAAPPLGPPSIAGGVPPPRMPPPFSSNSSSSSSSSAHNPTPTVQNYNVAVGLFDFESNESDDLAFKAGDVVTLTASPESEDWWQGELNGRTGMFPKNYVSKADGQGRFIGADGTVIGTVDSVRAGQVQAAIATSNATGGVAAAAAAHVTDAPSAPPLPYANANANAGWGAAGGGAAGGAHANAEEAAPTGEDAPRLINATCVALYDFEGQDTDELSFRAGEKLVITGELNGWYLGRQESGTKVGIFPSNYVAMYDPNS